LRTQPTRLSSQNSCETPLSACRLSSYREVRTQASIFAWPRVRSRRAGTDPSPHVRPLQFGQARSRARHPGFLDNFQSVATIRSFRPWRNSVVSSPHYAQTLGHWAHHHGLKNVPVAVMREFPALQGPAPGSLLRGLVKRIQRPPPEPAALLEAAIDSFSEYACLILEPGGIITHGAPRRAVVSVIPVRTPSVAHVTSLHAGRSNSTSFAQLLSRATIKALQASAGWRMGAYNRRYVHATSWPVRGDSRGCVQRLRDEHPARRTTRCGRAIFSRRQVPKPPPLSDSNDLLTTGFADDPCRSGRAWGPALRSPGSAEEESRRRIAR